MHLAPVQAMAVVKPQEMVLLPQVKALVTVKHKLMVHQLLVLEMAQAKVKLQEMEPAQVAQEKDQEMLNLMVHKQVAPAQVKAVVQPQVMVHQHQVQAQVKVQQTLLTVALAQFKALATSIKI